MDDYDYDVEASHNTFFWDELLPTLIVYCLTFVSTIDFSLLSVTLWIKNQKKFFFPPLPPPQPPNLFNDYFNRLMKSRNPLLIRYEKMRTRNVEFKFSLHAFRITTTISSFGHSNGSPAYLIWKCEILCWTKKKRKKKNHSNQRKEGNKTNIQKSNMARAHYRFPTYPRVIWLF